MKKILSGVIALLASLPLTAQHQSAIIKTNSEREVIPEGIAINPTDGKIYVSSIALHKILEIEKNGKHKELIKERQHGFLEGLGLKVDAKKQLVWALSNEKQGTDYVSMVHAFDIRTGAEKHKFVITDTTQHLFNDLILHPNGSIYITDTYGASIYVIDAARKDLKVLITDSLITYPNGITNTPAGKVYIATYSNGPVQLDVNTKGLKQLKGYSDSARAYNLDGLVYWNNSIIAVHNGEKTDKDNSIQQYWLNEAGDKIIKETQLDKGNEFFHSPTTAALYEDKLYVLSNSHLRDYNNNNESAKGISDKLSPVLVLVYDLKNK
ncbi:hypothetical protein HHL16_07925 [Pseudoflavitalea sp. G-6-1-2]|uniref:SMP-30/gluconolactonase/LRE family protein n=1 Tax=Pseudoflavitalea sp. G-6-1-2 TaxID=2728841 RepID=UPI00146D2118|nr:hypothetical protein [Pseudoflavitalea sp. G-6-1-2]NML20797.1 hypothetical protein [Pseudoflavitalea sp. G-6-1-2]